MKVNRGFHARMLASAIALALVAWQSSYLLAQDPPSSPAVASPSSQLPDSPGSVQSPQNSAPATSNADETPAQATQDQQSPPPQTQSTQQQAAKQQPTQQAPAPRQPVGTAAAETVPTTGVAASRPAGAALAPAKQRRVRSILIKVGFLAGAAAAIGTTVALSESSPSKPPGTR